jgi:hypothetical protein
MRSDRRVRPELDDGVECAVCGEQMRNLGQHLRVHGIDRAEYLRRFPGAALVNADVRAILRDRAIDRGYAAYWTDPERGRARIIAALRADATRRGRAPTQAEWSRGRGDGQGGLTGKLHTRPASSTVKKVLGTWAVALDAAGLSANERKRNRSQKRCKYGHPFDEANTYIEPGGGRKCRLCRRRIDREREARTPERRERRREYQREYQRERRARAKQAA